MTFNTLFDTACLYPDYIHTQTQLYPSPSSLGTNRTGSAPTTKEEVHNGHAITSSPRSAPSAHF